MREAAVARSGETEPGLVRGPERRREVARERADHRRRVVGRRVVDDQHLRAALACLGRCRLEGTPEQVGPVVGADDDARADHQRRS